TFRSHTRRLTQGDLPTYSGIEVALGEPADRPLTAWDEAFLPVRFQQRLREVRVRDALGRPVPLVADERQLFEARRAPEPSAPPGYLAGYAIAGLTLAGVLGFVAHRAARGAGAARAVFGGLGTLW